MVHEFHYHKMQTSQIINNINIIQCRRDPKSLPKLKMRSLCDSMVHESWSLTRRAVLERLPDRHGWFNGSVGSSKVLPRTTLDVHRVGLDSLQLLRQFQGDAWHTPFPSISEVWPLASHGVAEGTDWPCSVSLQARPCGEQLQDNWDFLWKKMKTCDPKRYSTCLKVWLINAYKDESMLYNTSVSWSNHMHPASDVRSSQGSKPLHITPRSFELASCPIATYHILHYQLPLATLPFQRG